MISPQSQKIIDQYFNLPFGELKNVRCPYFNNTRIKQKAQLRALIGKGTPEEIVEEAKILAKQYGEDYLIKDSLTAKEAMDFLAKHNLGIDCSGFVSHVLTVHFKESKNINLTKNIHFGKNNLFRKIIIKFRPLENMSVLIYTNNKNTDLIGNGKEPMNYNNIQAGDLIIMLEMEKFKNQNHILLITENKNCIIKYTHSRQWQNETPTDSGVYFGEIKITKPQENLLAQEWMEKGLTGKDNQTLELKAKSSRVLEIRRIRL
jgi:hypothetical protein